MSVTVNFLNQEYTLTDGKWEGPNSQHTAFLQVLTDPNAVSGADPSPDLAMAQAVQKILPGLEIVRYDTPEFDPQAIY